MASKQLNLRQLRVHPLDEFIDLIGLARMLATRRVDD
jgi:hypothetical protein